MCVRLLTLTLVVLNEEAFWTAGDTTALMQAEWAGTGRAVVCRWSSTEPAGGMTLWKGHGTIQIFITKN